MSHLWVIERKTRTGWRYIETHTNRRYAQFRVRLMRGHYVYRIAKYRREE